MPLCLLPDSSLQPSPAPGGQEEQGSKASYNHNSNSEHLFDAYCRLVLGFTCI